MGGAGETAAWAVGKQLAKWVDPLFGIAITGTKILKAGLDAETRKRLEEVQDQEACPHIKACADYGLAGDRINAMTAAKDGKTAWEAPNTLWVYHDQIDFAPMHARQVYHMRADGKWEAQGGSWKRRITGGPCKRCVTARGARK